MERTMPNFFFYSRRSRHIFPFLTLFALVTSTSKVCAMFSASGNVTRWSRSKTLNLILRCELLPLQFKGMKNSIFSPCIFLSFLHKSPLSGLCLLYTSIKLPTPKRFDTL
uniref:Uncharacterized protein n=1 Tax=Arundo donax TaxID=35708 RepID=A0A0A9EB65_ARUDO